MQERRHFNWAIAIDLSSSIACTCQARPDRIQRPHLSYTFEESSTRDGGELAPGGDANQHGFGCSAHKLLTASEEAAHIRTSRQMFLPRFETGQLLHCRLLVHLGRNSWNPVNFLFARHVGLSGKNHSGISKRVRSRRIYLAARRLRFLHHPLPDVARSLWTSITGEDAGQPRNRRSGRS
jgi:hypothetical protein